MTHNKHKLEPLPYPYDALEPFIDEKTMKIHHGKHHQAYVDKLNAAIEKYPELHKLSAEELITNIEDLPSEIQAAVRNNGGGHVNHAFFWQLLKKDVKPKEEILAAIKDKFGNLDLFEKEFANAAITRFGSGWAWLVVNKNRELEIVSTHNQDNLLTDDKKPVLGLDVWEHAYYLKYQNRRPEYIQAFFNIIDWEKVNENYLQALK